MGPAVLGWLHKLLPGTDPDGQSFNTVELEGRSDEEMSARGAEGQVVVLLSGPTERLVLDALALLAQDYPRFAGTGFERAVTKLAARLPTGATPMVVSQVAVLLS
jgi:hypothetical protein